MIIWSCDANTLRWLQSIAQYVWPLPKTLLQLESCFLGIRLLMLTPAYDAVRSIVATQIAGGSLLQLAHAFIFFMHCVQTQTRSCNIIF